MRRTLPALVALLAIVLPAVPALAGGAPSQTIVLVNSRSEESKRVAARYVAARHIPPTNVVRVSCEPGLTVPRDDFVRDVIEPLREHLRRTVTHPTLEGEPRSLLARARYVVLTQGMPIRADGTGGAVSTAEMLMLLDTAICGQDGNRMPRFRNPNTSGPVGPPGDDGSVMLLATALVSSTADEALGLIERSVASDGTSPQKAHWIYQDAAGAAGVRNDAYDAARRVLEGRGHTTEHVGRGKDVATGRKRVMGYMSGGSYSALSPDGVATNEYLPGAICDMLQSFGAVPRNFGPNGEGGTQFPVTHMVRAGITGVHGTVAEPYNVAFPPADLFDAYERGFTLAETFHMRIPFRYWMNLVIGDPICAPYAARTDVRIDAPSDAVTTPEEITVDAAGATSIRVLLDGLLLAEGAGESLTFPLDPATVAPGEHTLLAEALLPGESAPWSWSVATVTTETDGPVVLARPTTTAAGGDLAIRLSDPNVVVAASVATDAGDELDVTVRSAADGVRLELAPPPRAGSTLVVTLTAGATTATWSVAVGPAALRVEGPETTEAGQGVELVVTAVDAAGAAIPGWRGHVELRSVDPPVRWWRTRFGEGGTATMKFASTDAGAVDFVVTAPGTGLREAHSLDVVHGPAHHATTPLSRVPLGQVTDLPIRVEDRFGNVVRSWSGTIEAKLPGDPHARIRGDAEIRDGSGVLRDVVVTKPGRQALRLSGDVSSQPNEAIEGRPDAVRAWLVASGDGDDPWTGDPAEGLTSDGGVAGGRLFRRLRSGASWITLPTSVPNGAAAVATTFVEALADTEVSLRLAAAARVRVLLDGDEVWSGVPEATNVRKEGTAVAELALPAGVHVLTVVAERKGAFRLRVELAKEDAVFDRALRIRADADRMPGRVVLSGTVHRPGGRGVPDAIVIVAPEGGEPIRATTDRDGAWYVDGATEGPVTVRLEEAPGLAEPMERTVEVEDRHVPGIDFRVADRVAPVVEIALAAKTKAGRRLRVPTEISDDGGVAAAWIEIDGERVGAPSRRAPFTVEIDVADRPRGALEIVVAARDDAGNVGRSAPATVELITDTRGPTISIRGLSRNATLKKPTEITARVSDDLPIAQVIFRVDGETVGVPRTAEPFTLTLDPAAFDEGRHVVEVVARDADGNERTKDLSFRVR